MLILALLFPIGFLLALKSSGDFLSLLEGIDIPWVDRAAAIWTTVLSFLRREEFVRYTVIGLGAILAWNVGCNAIHWQAFLRWTQWSSLFLALFATPLSIVSILSVTSAWERILSDNSSYHGPDYYSLFVNWAAAATPAPVFWAVFLTAFWWLKHIESEQWRDEMLRSPGSGRRRNLIQTLTAEAAHPGALIVQLMFIPLGFLACEVAIPFIAVGFPVEFESEIRVNVSMGPSSKSNRQHLSELRLERDGSVYLDGVPLAPISFQKWAASEANGRRLLVRVHPEATHEILINALDVLAAEGAEVALLDLGD